MDLAKAKENLLEAIGKEVLDEGVLQAMRKVPRESFIPLESQHLAYEDIPLPIGHGQTISQPIIVALMTHALELKGTDKVLEVGTGSGYQAAILAERASKVITVERIPSLADSAKALLRSMGYTHIEVRLAENTLGCREEAPFDAILVTAGSPKLPEELLDQMALMGRLVVPVGSAREQELMKVVKSNDGYSVHVLGGCRFVPLIGAGAWPSENDLN